MYVDKKYISFMELYWIKSIDDIEEKTKELCASDGVYLFSLFIFFFREGVGEEARCSACSIQ